MISDIKVGFEFKDRDLEFLNQPVSFIPFSIKIHLPKPKWKNIVMKKDRTHLFRGKSYPGAVSRIYPLQVLPLILLVYLNYLLKSSVLPVLVITSNLFTLLELLNCFSNSLRHFV